MEPKTITKLSEPDVKLKESQLGPLHWLPVIWQWQRFMQNLHVLTCLNIRYIPTFKNYGSIIMVNIAQLFRQIFNC